MVSLRGFGTMYVRTFLEGTGTSITADCGGGEGAMIQRVRRTAPTSIYLHVSISITCMQSVGNATCSPATSQMQLMPTVVSEHDSARQKADVDSHVPTVAFLTATVASPAEF